MTDPIADMLTQIRNAFMVLKPEVVLPHSKFKQHLANLLVQEGILEESETIQRGERQWLRLKLRYVDGRPAASNLLRVSTPGQRQYARADELPRTQNGFGITIISTSKGLRTDRQARKEHLGGEIICQIW